MVRLCFYLLFFWLQKNDFLQLEVNFSSEQFDEKIELVYELYTCHCQAHKFHRLHSRFGDLQVDLSLVLAFVAIFVNFQKVMRCLMGLTKIERFDVIG